MKIRLENFLSHQDKTFEFGSEGLVLVAGPSGAGKTSILKGIFFALFGEGTKLESYGKSSTRVEVELEFEDLKIVRTKHPNRLVVNDAYEDQAGQEIINERFSETFKSTGYIAENLATSFILKSPGDKLEMLEKFMSRDFDISEVKKQQKSEIMIRKDELTGASSNLVMMTELLNDTEEPPQIKFPLSCRSSNREIAIKNVRIKHKNCSVRIRRAENEQRKLQKELVAIRIMIAKLEGHTSQLTSLIGQHKKMGTKLKNDFPEVPTSENLDRHQHSLRVIDAREELYNLKTAHKKAQKELMKMNESEEAALKKELEKKQSELYSEYTLDDLNATIEDTRTSLVDFKRVSVIAKEIESIKSTPTLIEIERKEAASLREKIGENNAKYQQLKLSQDLYVCPSCSKTLKLCEDRLVISQSEKTTSSTREIDRIDKKMKDLQLDLQNLDSEIANDVNALERKNNLQKEHDNICSQYEEVVSITELQKDLDYLVEYKATQKILAKRVSHLQSDLAQEARSRAYILFRDKVDDMATQIEEMEESSLPTQKLEIEDRQILVRIIEENKDKLHRYETLKKQISDIDKTISYHREAITEAREKHEEKFKDNQDISTLTELIGKCQQEIDIQCTSRHKHASIIKKIEEWEKHEEAQKRYEDLRQKVKNLRLQEQETKKRYAAVMILKEKILESESLVMLHLIDTINTHARPYLDAFFPIDPISVHLKTFKKTKKSVKPSINVQLEYKGMEPDIDQISSGERSRVALAYTLALAEIFNTPLLLLDECTASLDADHTSAVLEGIRENFNGKLVLMIAHQVVAGTFDRVLELPPGAVT